MDEADEPIVVTAQRKLPAIRSATKTDTPLRNVPQAVAIVGRDTIDDRAMTSIVDVLRTVPGAAVASGEGNRDQIILRGQNSTADFFVDGIRDDAQYFRPLYNLERVEVLKGPNAMIFGRGGGGGIVNRVTKRADGKRGVGGALSADAFGDLAASVDLAAPLSPRLDARVNAFAERLDSYRDDVDGYRWAVNPTLGWQPGESTRLDLSIERVHDRRTADRGIPSQGGRPLGGARDRFFGDVRVNRAAFDGTSADAVLDRALGAVRWTVRGRLSDIDKSYANALAATAVGADGRVGMEAYRSTVHRRAAFVQNDLVAKLETGPVRHTLLVGADIGVQRTDADRQQGFFDAAGTVQRLYVDAASADRLPAITFRDSPLRRATDARTRATATGLYVQDQVEIGEHLQLVAGLRRDWFRLAYADRLSSLRLTRTDRNWSPRLGLVVKPVAALSLYASWSKSFLPQSGDQFASLTATTAALAPEKFLNREVGAKWAATPALDLTLAAYLLDRTNTRATDPATNLTVLTGAQRSKGIEASADGRFGRLTLNASAALQSAKISRMTAAAPAGRWVAGVPAFTGSLWGRYQLNDRFGLGAGLYHQSKGYASISNAVVVPAFTRIDAAAFVKLTDRIEAQVNVENVANKYYIGLANSDNNLTPGAPRSVKATLRVGL
ncbi:TonB-dependent receptor [Sphingomonas sp. ASV193]|uniref:TonB-dependent receptor n=1 Tax=Sphingomonas sp. ASV193 TaxID=3144405 RepID=UPI0032E8B206